MRTSGIGVLLAGLLAVAMPASASAERVVLSTGHTDALDVLFEDGALTVDVKDDTVEPSVLRDPADVIFHARPESEFVIPDGFPEYAFLGAPGESTWILPQIQEPDILWPGWETQRVPRGVFVDERLTFGLLEIDGPGRFHLFFVGALGEPTVVLDSTNGLPDAMSVPTTTHAHANWAFSEPGLYSMTFEVTGRLVSGGEISSGPIEHRFFVGDLADLPDLPETELSVDGLAESYEEGETVSLLAVQDPDTGLDDYRWSARCPADAAFQDVDTGPSLEFAARLADDGCQYRVTLRGEAGARIARSAPVTLEVRGAPPVPPPAPPGTITMPQPSTPAPRVTTPPPKRLTLRAIRARLRGRTLTLRLQVSARSRVTISVRRAGRTVARTKARTVAPGRRVLRVRLGRRPPAGRYTLRVRASSRSRALTRTLPLSVR